MGSLRDSGGSVTNCYVVGQVIAAGQHSGGLAGEIVNGVLADCYATGNVSSSNWGVGGLIGLNSGSTVSRCYSIGKPTGTTQVGGLVGCEASGTDTANFWDTNTSETETSAMGTGKTTDQMKTEATFTDAGWNFSTVWQIQPGSYPYLRSPAQSPPPGATPVMIVLGTNGAVIANNEAVSADKGTDFGQIALDSSATNTFSITNAATTTLTISSWTTNGAGANKFSIIDMPATVGANLSFSATGTVCIVASQAGNTNWNAAPNVTNTFNVTAAPIEDGWRRCPDIVIKRGWRRKRDSPA